MMASFNVEDVWSGDSIDFPEDDRLRSFGFKLVLRPRFGEPTWKLGKVSYSHQAALRYCRDMEAMGHGATRSGDDKPTP